MSSASVLHILEKIIDTCPPPPGSAGLMIGLGPGRQRRAGAAAMVTGRLDLEVYWALLAVIAVERVAELVVSQRHAAALPAPRRRGIRPGTLPGHGGAARGAAGRLLASSRWPCTGRSSPRWRWPMLVVVVAANSLRWWCIATLGPRWTARVIVIPGAAAGQVRPVPLVRAPELCRGRRGGRGAAAGRLGVDHRVHVHRRERRAAHRPAALRDAGAGRGRVIAVPA